MSVRLWSKYANIVVDRRGSTTNSFMRTVDVVGEVSPRRTYLIGTDKLTEIPYKYVGISVHDTIVRPSYSILAGRWMDNKDGYDQSNILGGIGSLIANTPRLYVPGEVATAKKVAFYGAQLVSVGDGINFETDTKLPVTVMNVGSRYVQDYIMEQNGANGVYLEHHDRPHFHMPLNDEAAGYLVLGKKSGHSYLLTGFRIPYGYAVYTPPNVIHNDCFLIGRYLVVYSQTLNYSTVRLVDGEGAPVTVSII